MTTKRLLGAAGQQGVSARTLAVQNLLDKQPQLLVVEFGEQTDASGTGYRYRHMRRIDILEEARSQQQEPPLVSPGSARREVVSSMLQSRDLRILDPSFEIAKQPVILIRRGSIIVNLPPVRALILRGRTFFFAEEGADSLLAPILQRLANVQFGSGTKDHADAARASCGASGLPVPASSLPPEEGLPLEIDPTQPGEPLSFELKVLETCLVAVVVQLRKEFNALVPRVMQAGLHLQSSLHAENFDALRNIKHATGELISRSRAFAKLLNDLLESPSHVRALSMMHIVTHDVAAAPSPVAGGSPASEPAIPVAALVPTGHTGTPHRNLTGGNDEVQTHYAGTVTSTARVRPRAASSGVTTEHVSAFTGLATVHELEGPAAGVRTHHKRKATSRSRSPSVVSPTLVGAAVGGLDAYSDGAQEDAAEILLEAYLGEVTSVLARTKLLRGQIEATEAQANLVMASSRNRLLRVEVGLTLITLSLTVCTIPATFFGMNVLNGSEGSFGAFLGIVLGSTCGSLVLLVVLGFYVRSMLY